MRMRSSFESPRRRFDLDAEPNDGSVIRRKIDIHPPPSGILSTAAGLAAVG
jgi:hypothetical protein